jgi:outer membrane protein TolC
MRILAGLTFAAAVAICGCTVDHAKEVATWRQVLDAKMPAPVESLPPQEVLTLNQALAMANRQNERLALTGEDYLQALIDKDRAVAAFLPSISIKPAYTRLQKFTMPGPFAGVFPNPTTDVPVHAELNVFNGFRDLANIERAEVIGKYRRAVLLDLQASILADTATVYYQILTLERQSGVLANSVKVQEDRVADMRAKLKAGVARPLDVAQTEAEAAATRTSLIDARRNLANARAGLAFLIGVPAVPNPLADGFEIPAVGSLEELQKQAAADRPDLAAAHALFAAAKKGLKVALGAYLPSVKVDFDYFLSKESFPPMSHWIFGVLADQPIFDGGRIHANVRTAYSLVRQARQYESLTERQVAEQVTVAYENLESSGRRIGDLETEVAAARQAYELAGQSYDVGLATNLERLVAQDRLLEAELQLAAERLNRKILYFRLAEAVGRLVQDVAAKPQPGLF